MHFHNKDPVDSKFVATNIYTGRPMIFIMDPKVKSKYIVTWDVDYIIITELRYI